MKNFLLIKPSLFKTDSLLDDYLGKIVIFDYKSDTFYCPKGIAYQIIIEWIPVKVDKNAILKILDHTKIVDPISGLLHYEFKSDLKISETVYKITSIDDKVDEINLKVKGFPPVVRLEAVGRNFQYSCFLDDLILVQRSPEEVGDYEDDKLGLGFKTNPNNWNKGLNLI